MRSYLSGGNLEGRHTALDSNSVSQNLLWNEGSEPRDATCGSGLPYAVGAAAGAAADVSRAVTPLSAGAGCGATAAAGTQPFRSGQGGIPEVRFCLLHQSPESSTRWQCQD